MLLYTLTLSILPLQKTRGRSAMPPPCWACRLGSGGRRYQSHLAAVVSARIFRCSLASCSPMPPLNLVLFHSLTFNPDSPKSTPGYHLVVANFSSPFIMLTLRALSAFCAVSLCMISSSLAFQIKVTNNCNEPIAVAASQHKWNESISDFPLVSVLWCLRIPLWLRD